MTTHNVANLKQIRSSKCPHALAYAQDPQGNLAIGCPVCDYYIGPNDRLVIITAPKASIVDCNLSEALNTLPTPDVEGGGRTM